MNLSANINDDYRETHKSKDKGVRYDRSFRTTNYKSIVFDWEKQVLLKIVSQNKCASYLDFASGTGRIAQVVENHVERSKGIDVSESMLEVARQNCIKTQFVKVDITKEEIDFQNKFDLITAFRFFTNAQHDLRNDAMAELSRIIEPNGLFIFNIHMNKKSPYAVLARLHESIFGKRKGFNYVDQTYLKDSFLTRYGFEIKTVFGFGIFPVIREGKSMSTLSRSIVTNLEKFLANFPFLKQYCKYQIVVCKRI